MAGCHAQHQPAAAGQANLAWMARIRVYTASTDPRLPDYESDPAWQDAMRSTSRRRPAKRIWPGWPGFACIQPCFYRVVAAS